MKKKIVLSLATLMCISLCACGNSNSTSDNDTEIKKEESTSASNTDTNKDKEETNVDTNNVDTNNYSITEDELHNTWQYKYDDEIYYYDFTNATIKGNFIVEENGSCSRYEYIDGNLFITQQGGVFEQDNAIDNSSITETELKTVWHMGNTKLDFTNATIQENFIYTSNNMCFYYEYMDGKLYVTGYGNVLEKDGLSDNSVLSEDELKSEWKNGNNSMDLSKVTIKGDFIVFPFGGCSYYEYIGGKLYITGYGVVLEKKE